MPRAWAEGFAALSTMPAPTGFLPDRWARIVDAVGVFIDRWASTAAACGWSDLDIFGCDPDAPDRRFDCMGLTLLLERCEIVALDRDGADLVMHKTGSRQRYRRRPLPPDTISLWQLSRTIPATGDEPEDDGAPLHLQAELLQADITDGRQLAENKILMDPKNRTLPETAARINRDMTRPLRPPSGGYPQPAARF